MIISLVVAATENNVIGKNNQLLWHLPNDLKFFKNTTWAMPVIMGRKTFESIKKQPLSGRFNIIITSKKDLQPASGKIQIADSIERSMQLAGEADCKEAFVIGGGEIFNSFFPMADKIYLTRVHANLEGDTFFPPITEKEWQLQSSFDFPADEKHAYPYSFQLWKRIG
ncbi:MAG TPA: dihydrofolate reductase [Chitinophagaceae bacterium]|nr:dihydrofolate reductase [Chitinophagaceae bacterium]